LPTQPLYPSSIIIPAQIHRLNQGLTVIHQYLPNNPVTVTDVWVKAGALLEPPSWQGIAHFVEHMIFKGSSLVKPGVFDQVVEENGGMTNAGTSHDYAHFFLTTATEYLNQTLPFLAEILLQAEIDEEEFYREREVVLEELKSCYDDPDFISFQMLSASLYHVHPYGECILGTEELLYKHTPQRLRCFHQTHYQPQNMTVVMVGGMPENQALELLNETFCDFAIPSECPNFQIEAEPPLVSIRRQEIELPRIEHSRLLMGWLGSGVENIEDNLALDLLSVILAGSRSSRLVRKLRETLQVVIDIGSSFSLQKDSSLFTITAHLEREYLELVEDKIVREILDLQKNLVEPEELRKAQKLFYHDFLFSTESPGQLAGLYGYYHTIASLEIPLNYPAKIKQLTRENLQRVAQQYLSVEHYAVTIVKPLQKSNLIK